MALLDLTKVAKSRCQRKKWSTASVSDTYSEVLSQPLAIWN